MDSSRRSLTVGQAADYLGLSKRMIYDAIKAGTLKAWRPYARGDQRINIEELDRWRSGRPQIEEAATAA